MTLVTMETARIAPKISTEIELLIIGQEPIDSMRSGSEATAVVELAKTTSRELALGDGSGAGTEGIECDSKEAQNPRIGSLIVAGMN
jgi:hypothetical protein